MYFNELQQEEDSEIWKLLRSFLYLLYAFSIVLFSLLAFVVRVFIYLLFLPTSIKDINTLTNVYIYISFYTILTR